MPLGSVGSCIHVHVPSQTHIVKNIKYKGYDICSPVSWQQMHVDQLPRAPAAVMGYNMNYEPKQTLPSLICHWRGTVSQQQKCKTVPQP